MRRRAVRAGEDADRGRLAWRGQVTDPRPARRRIVDYLRERDERLCECSLPAPPRGAISAEFERGSWSSASTWTACASAWPSGAEASPGLSWLMQYDVAVVGAGPAGSATARRLARCGLPRGAAGTVRLRRAARRRVARAVGERAARELGVWPRFTGARPAAVVRHAQRLGRTGRRRATPTWSSPYGCGWHVDRAAFDRDARRGRSGGGCQVRCATTCAGVERRRWVVLGITEERPPGPERARARVLVDATGRGAGRPPAGARRSCSTGWSASGARSTGSDVDKEGYVLVEATPEGWWYSAHRHRRADGRHVDDRYRPLPRRRGWAAQDTGRAGSAAGLTAARSLGRWYGAAGVPGRGAAAAREDIRHAVARGRGRSARGRPYFAAAAWYVRCGPHVRRPRLSLPC